MGALSALKKAKPLVSKFDEALEKLARPKGTGNEFLAEVMKQPGVKKAEIEDRKLKQAFEKAGKITKEQAQEIAKKHAPAKLEEKVFSEPSLNDIEARAHEMAYDDAFDELRDEGMNRHEAADIASEMAEDRIQQYMDAAAEDLFESGVSPQHGEWTLPGGENYREILLKMPAFAGDKKIMELEAMRRRVDPELHTNRYNELTQQIDALKAEKAQHPEQFQGVKQHFAGEPGIIASLRVKDRVGPGGEKVLHIEEIQSDWHQKARDIRNKEIKRIVKEEGITKKEAAARVPEDFGYKQKYEPKIKQVSGETMTVSDLIQKYGDEGRKWFDNQNAMNEDLKLPFLNESSPVNVLYHDGVPQIVSDASKRPLDEMIQSHQKAVDKMQRESEMMHSHGQRDKAPDAPFKKNWQELALKKALNYAAENGYDKIAITPGVEQVNRYKLSNHINQVEVYKLPDGTYNLEVIDKSGSPVSIPDSRAVDAERISEIVGKDVAQKAISQADEAGQSILGGLDLEVGGKGMKGFYDKIIPDYLNTLGKKYGSQVGVYDMPNPKTGLSITDIQREQGLTDQQWLDLSGDEKMRLIDEMDAKAKANTTPLHTFDITPELREEITTKGLPLYQQIGLPIGTGVGSYEFNAPEPEYAEGGAVNYNTQPDMNDGGAIIQGAPYKRGGKVKITDNLDEMFMEVNNKKFQRK